MFAVNRLTHQKVPNETYEQDQGKDEKSHSKGYSQDSCPKKGNLSPTSDFIYSEFNVIVQNVSSKLFIMRHKQSLVQQENSRRINIYAVFNTNTQSIIMLTVLLLL